MTASAIRPIRARGTGTQMRHSVKRGALPVNRFWSKVRTGTENECWVWQASVNPGGYGKFSIDGRVLGSHRIAWQLVNRACILPGYYVCHRCDNPACCNPAHLFVATAETNNQDMHDKGRHSHGADHRAAVKRTRPRGDRHHKAVWQEWQIPYVRFLSASGMSYRTIADAYGMREGTVGQVIRKENWGHVPDALDDADYKGKR